jgi:membrane-associated protease RseP (regulator of RpoE activity)
MSLESTLFEYRYTILFYSAVLFLIYLSRSKLEKQGTLMYIMRTKFGLKMMDRLSSSARGFFKVFGYISIAVAYLGFIFISYALLQSAYDIIIDKPGAVGGSPVIPGLPIAGTGLVFPLVIGWISLFIIMIVHEFSHGVVAKAHGIRIKSSGIAFFGPILGAFVEPDEKDLQKKKHRVQHSVFAAGPVSNVVLWIACVLLMFALVPLVDNVAMPTGISMSPIVNDTLPAYNAGMKEKTVITFINGMRVNDSDTFYNALENITPGQQMELIGLSGETYSFTTAENPLNASKGYLGITNFEQHYTPIEGLPGGGFILAALLWLLELLKWTGFISINIGLINLFPIFITDGAQMLRLNFKTIFKNEDTAMSVWKNVNIAALMVVLIVLLLPLVRTILRMAAGLVMTV